jgi:SAM-dependent methyltransferase
MKRFVKYIVGKFGYQLSKIPQLHTQENKKSFLQEHYLPKRLDEFRNISFAYYAIQKLIVDLDFDTVLDIGSGAGEHTQCFLQHNKTVTAIDFGKSFYFEKRIDNYNYIQTDYNSYKFEQQFDAIWASHILEHQPNPNAFLKKIYNDLKDGGILAITVPPLKHEIVGGHVTLWNAGLLLYQLILAGFDCQKASVLKYGYNISMIVKKKRIDTFPELAFDKGDIERLLDYFPDGFTEPFNGDINNLNWE